MSNIKQPPLVIYHANCADGFTAAWAIWKKHPDWMFHPGVYQQPPPDVTGRDVYIVDFSYKRPVMEQIFEQANCVVVLDHHKTAMEDLAGYPLAETCEEDFHDRAKRCRADEGGREPGDLVGVNFDMSKSGARMTWDWFHPGEPLPEIVRIVEERDLWKEKSPTWEQTRQIMANIFSYGYFFETWDELAARLETRLGTAQMSVEGEAIERKHFKDVSELVAASARSMRIGGTVVQVANVPYTLSSDAGHFLANKTPGAFGACYMDTPKGRQFSLRSNADGMDVGAIAKLYGGGGHMRAAGFTVPIGWGGDDAIGAL